MENNKLKGIKNLLPRVGKIAKFASSILIVGGLAYAGGRISANNKDKDYVLMYTNNQKSMVYVNIESCVYNIYKTNEDITCHYTHFNYLEEDALGYIVYCEPYIREKVGENLGDRYYQTIYVYRITDDSLAFVDSEEERKQILSSDLKTIHEKFEFVTLFDNTISLEDFNKNNMSLDETPKVTIVIKQNTNSKQMTK